MPERQDRTASAPADRHELPIYALAEDIRRLLPSWRKLIISAPTGSGKSTQLPQLLLDLVPSGQRIVVLQPRRLAARMLAERVAWETGTQTGGLVGYQTRYERAHSRDTRILFLTEGILSRMLLSSPSLPGIGAIIFDEFHERSLNIDLALAMARHCQNTCRPDLLLLVMSATLEAAPLSAYLDSCPALTASGRQFPIQISYCPAKTGLYAGVSAAVRDILSSTQDGDILVFLPGAAEIRNCREELRRSSWPEELELLPLYGELPPAEQRRVMQPCDNRKIILATNIAETSLTIPGVRHVIDSGLARIMRHDPTRGVNILETCAIARDSAEQRAGRAGREGPGTCRRLWSQLEHNAKPARTSAEVERLDLSEALLAINAYGFTDPSTFPWFEEPPANHLLAAQNLLLSLGLLRRHCGGLSDLGRQVLRYPAHPRCALLLHLGVQQGCAREAAYTAAMLAERPLITAASSDRATLTRLRQDRRQLPPSDFLAALELLQQARQARFAPGVCQSLGIHPGAARDICRAAEDYLAMLPGSGTGSSNEASFLRCLLQVFPDRLARRRDHGTLLCDLQNQRRAELSRYSLARGAQLLVAGEIREVSAAGTPAVKLELSLASGVEEEWLWELFPDDFSENDEVFWDSRSQQVMRRRSLSCLQLVLEETVRNDAPPEAAATLLAEQIVAHDLHLQGWDSNVEAWIARVRFLAEHFPEQALPLYDDADRKNILLALCQDEYAYRAVRGKDCLPWVRGLLNQSQIQFVERMAPTHLPLPSGRKLRLEYVPGQPPKGRARIQDLYDCTDRPCVAGGRIPVLLDILAPNMRTVQITDDLPRFWAVHYPTIKSALARRYPKHEWR